MISTKIYKNGIDWDAYGKAAEWCNANTAIMVDKGEYYEVCNIPEPSLDELKEGKKSIIKKLLDSVSYKTEKFVDGAMSEDEYAPVRLHKQKWREAYNAVEAATTKEELSAVTWEG